MAEVGVPAARLDTVREPLPPRAKPRVLAADDEESMRFFVGRGLRRLGYDVEVTASGAQFRLFQYSQSTW